MSEEELMIETLKSFVEDENTGYVNDWEGFDYDVILPRIQQLLDLYNQQKQQITELQAINEEHKKENRELRKKLKQEKEKNKKLEEEDIKTRAKFILSLDDYIHKDKIQAVIEEIKKEKNIASENLLKKAVNYAVDGAVCQELDYFQGKLEELLED